MNRPAPHPSPEARPRRCAACLRLRLAALALLAALGAALAMLPSRAADTAAASAPAAPAPAASVAPPASPTVCSGPFASALECQDLRWLYTAVPLPAARLGASYAPRLLVKGGRGAYRFALIDGSLPPGLALAPDGTLAGTPTRVGSYAFTLAVHDASAPAQASQQGYTLRVLPPPVPAAAAAPRAAPSAPASGLSSIPSDDANLRVSEVRAASIRSYQLTSADLDSLAPPPPPPAVPASGAAAAEPLVEPVEAPAPAPAAASAPAPEPAPTPDQLRELLTPLVNVDYPTRELFEASLAFAHCNYFKALAAAAARKQGLAGEAPPCPPPTTTTAPRADAITVSQLYAQLMPANLRRDILVLAEKTHALADAKPVQWFGDAEPPAWWGSDCGCAPGAALGEIYAIYPFWLAGGQPQPMDFSLFRRISYLGAIPDDAGEYQMPPGWDSPKTGFTRTAQRYGTEVDLVLYRRDWSSLLRQSAALQLRAAQRAAVNAVRIVDTRPDDLASTLNRLLLPFWSEPARLYGGVTVYFDDSAGSPADREAFRSLFRAFMRQLIAEMQATGRTYALNIVVPEPRLGERGPFGVDELAEYLELASPSSMSATTATVEPAGTVDYKANTPVKVRFVVPLAEPTSDHKKAVRERIDRSESLKGHRRNEFLKSLVPTLFYAGGAKPAPFQPEQATRLDADLQYFWWNFGNVAFWQPPMRDAGPGSAVGDVLAHSFALRDDGAFSGLCRYVCPARVPLRLLLQALIAVGAIAIGLYLGVCRVRRLGRPYLIALLVGGGITALVAAALLSCDPALDTVRAGNDLFYAVIVLLFAGGAYALLRPRVDKP